MPRQVFVVSCAHEGYYSKELADAKDSVVIAQPMNRGTAVGIIAALVRIMPADPDAVVGFFPCDDYYSDDESFRSIVSSATAGAEQFPQSLVIVGVEAEYAETEYGWIEPTARLLSSSCDVVLWVTRALADNDLAPTYARLQSVDFSRDVPAHQANRRLVLRDSGSGWADLGSPDRVLGLLAKNFN